MPQIPIHASRHEHVSLFFLALNKVVEIGARLEHRRRADDLTHRYEQEAEGEGEVVEGVVERGVGVRVEAVVEEGFEEGEAMGDVVGFAV